MSLNLNIDSILNYARLNECSDVHLTFSSKPAVRRHGKMHFLEDLPVLDKELIEQILLPIFSEDMVEDFNNGNDLDFSYQTKEGNRHRVNVFKQKQCMGAVFRLLNTEIPNLDKLRLATTITDFCDLPRGLVLVTGPTGSGKTTTLAAMLNYINERQQKHIISIEDPIEYMHRHNKCLVNQRELGEDTKSFAAALKSSLREDPDVILVGEMRDLETISLALTAAETGHLVFSTLHTTGAASTVDRIIDVFSEGQQNQIRVQLASVLKGVISQVLVPTISGDGRMAVQEILIVNDGVAALIRENKCHQLDSVIQTGSKLGMQSLDIELAKLVNDGYVDMYDAMEKMANLIVFKSYLTVNNGGGQSF